MLLVGCGALGCTIAELLTRAGVGRIVIADRDIVELTNLQRQTLFDESDAREGLPKAVAAVRRLGQINSSIAIDPLVVDVDADGIETLVVRSTGFQPVPNVEHGLEARATRARVDLILDGTDNVATRFLINDVAVKLGVPWIYGACVGTEGRVMTVRPGSGPCLRCVFPEPPTPGELATCDTAGVLGPVASIVASLQALAAIKILSGNDAAIANEMMVLDLWANRVTSISSEGAKRDDCVCCARRDFQFLNSSDRDTAIKLCGRNSIQIRLAPGANGPMSLVDLAGRLRSAGEVQASAFMVRCTLQEMGLSLSAFADGRILVHGTNDPARARSVVARFIGA